MTSSTLLAQQAWNRETDELDLGEIFPALRKYCPILYRRSDDLPGIHDSPQQCLFLMLDHREAFYGGAAGGGKTVALLAAALQYVDVPGYAALLLRRTFPQLSQPGQLIPLANEWFGPHKQDGVRWNDREKTWTFPEGGVIKFGHVKDEKAIYNYQGGAYHFVGFDELTQFTPTQFEYIAFSRQRRDKRIEAAGVPIRVRSAANPGGVGHAWVKKRYVEHRNSKIAFVPAKVYDNPGLDVPDYIENSLSHLGETLRRQLLDGDWGAFEGAAFELTDDHLVDEFPLDDAHDRFEACDYGLNGAPWALWAVDYEGNVIVYDMLYEHDLIPSQLAPLVVEKRKHGWGLGHSAYADPSIWHRTGGLNKWGRPAMLADEFTDHGVPVLPANNDPRAGMIRLRELLYLDPEHSFPGWHPRCGEKGAPRLFIIRTRCALLFEELGAAPLQPIDKRDGGEIIDPEWESQFGHACAMARYAGLTRPRPSVEPQRVEENMRARLAREFVDSRDGSKRRSAKWE